MLSRVRYVDYFESLSEYSKLRTPIELHRWDGKVYDASKDENIPAPEGQYFFRLRVKIKKMGPISIPICQSKLIIKNQRLSRLIPIV